MWKWKVAILGVVGCVAGIIWGYAQQKKAIGFFELRIYTAQPGKRETNVGYWIPQQSDPELGISATDTFIYIRGYPSKEERDKRLNAAHDDPEFAEVVTKQEAIPQTKLIVKAHNIDMVPNGTYTAITITK